MLFALYRSRIDHRSKHLAEVLVKELKGSPVGSLRGGPRAARRAVGLLIRLGRSAQVCTHTILVHCDSVQSLIGL